MRHPDMAVARAAVCGFALIAPLSTGSADRADLNRHTPPAYSTPGTTDQSQPGALDASARFSLDASDETAALQAVLIGLTEIADGASFAWRRPHGRLSGIVRPVFSFRNSEGEVCRQLTLTLRSGDYARTIEGIACRDEDGRWVLEG